MGYLLDVYDTRELRYSLGWKLGFTDMTTGVHGARETFYFTFIPPVRI